MVLPRKPTRTDCIRDKRCDYFPKADMYRRLRCRFARSPLGGDPYVARAELREYEEALVTLLSDLAYVFRPFPVQKHMVTSQRTAADVRVTNTEVRPRVRSGDDTPVQVTIRSGSTRQERVDVVLADITENVLIGRRALSLAPTASRTVNFDGETGGFRLGDHALEAQVFPIDGKYRRRPVI